MEPTALDLLIALFAVSAAAAGYRLGFVARAAAWAGVLAGLFVAALVVEPVVARVDASDPVLSLLVAATTILVLALLGQGVGLTIGSAVRRRFPRRGPARALDRAGGAVAGVVGVLITIWFLLPALGVVPGDIAAAARNSVVVDLVESAAPRPPQALRDLGRRIDETDFPEVFIGMRPAPEVSPPPEQIPLAPSIVERVAPSTVNVETAGCGATQDGSGFVAAPELVVTNAHVVAGADQIRVLRDDGERLLATLVGFDPGRDLAVLRVPGIDRQPLPLADTSVGAMGAVFGHPLGQDQLRVAPAGVAEVVDAVGRDIYGRSEVRRRVAVLSADLAPGDSGGALITGDGQVSGVAFAIAPDRRGTAFALATSELRAALSADVTGAVDSGPCI